MSTENVDEIHLQSLELEKPDYEITQTERT